MDFRRSGQLDERRRRVLRDELAQPADSETDGAAPTGGTSAKGPVRAYCAAVLDERQPRLTDLLPVRPLWTAVAVLLALTAVAAIECIHIHARTMPVAGGEHLASLDAAQRGSVASWFSSLVLACGGGLAFIAFSIRRHRVDDYRGRYRVWLWMTAALAWGSLDAATGIHSAVGLLLARLAGQSPAEAGPLAAATTISWLALYGLAFGTLAIRATIEVWNSLPSLAAIAIAGLAYFLAALATLGMLPASGPLVGSVVHSLLLMIAHVSLVSAVALYSRHVYLDATGRLKVHIDPDKKKQPKKTRTRLKVVKEEKSETAVTTATPPAAKPAAASSAPVKFQASPPSSGGPLAGKLAAAKTAASTNYDDEDDDGEEEGDDGERLSRAERRRLKKLAKRDGQRRAA
jgi:hypothetical protein